jgi:putative membrane protein
MNLMRYFLGAAVAAMVIPMCISLAAEPTNTAQPAGAAMSPQEQTEHFFKNCASDNTLEIKLAQLAQQRSSDEQVKTTAKMVEEDHQAANQLLQQIAQKNNIKVNPDEMYPVHQAVWDEFQSKQGDDFTRAYVFTMAGAHHTDVFVLNHAINKGSEASKEYATQILPKVRNHLNEFDKIARTLAGEPARASKGKAGAPGEAEPAGAKEPNGN